MRKLILTLVLISATFLQPQPVQARNVSARLKGCVCVNFKANGNRIECDVTGALRTKLTGMQTVAKKALRALKNSLSPETRAAIENDIAQLEKAIQKIPDDIKVDVDGKLSAGGTILEDETIGVFLDGEGSARINGYAAKLSSHNQLHMNAQKKELVYKNYSSLGVDVEKFGFSIPAVEVTSKTDASVRACAKPNCWIEMKVDHGTKLLMIDGTKAWIQVLYVSPHTKKMDMGFIPGSEVKKLLPSEPSPIIAPSQ
jgi:hypothetical protein